MNEPIYIIGHKRPDTDSICAALTLAYLKQQLGENAIAARIGHLNNETKFILKKVGVEPPVHIRTAKKNLQEIEFDQPVLLNRHETLRFAWDLLMGNRAKTIYVLDDEGNFIGLVTLAEISKVQMQDFNITRDLIKETPIQNLADVVHGSILFEADKERSGEVRIADKKMMERDLNGAIMLLEDHEDDMIKAMAKGASVLIIAENYTPSAYILDMAKNLGVSIIKTPYNLMRIVQMVHRAIPVEKIMTSKEEAISFHPTEFIEDVEEEMLKTRHSAYPVLEGDSIVGSVARYHLLKAGKKKFILVDHNETKQSIDDLSQGEILEIVDHHRIGGIQTDKPIIFRNMTVGCSNTIIAMMYEEYGIKMPEWVAKLIIYAIISDTLNFNSPTCTQTDRFVAQKIAHQFGLNTEEMARELFENTATIKDKEFHDLLYADCKEFDLGGNKVNISQVFVFDFKDVKKIEEDFALYMEEEISRTNLDLWVMAFTNVEGKGSRFVFAGKLKNKADRNKETFEAGGYVSRKKQIVPALSAVLR